MDEQYYQQLVKRYLDGSASDDELEVFAHLVKEGKLDASLHSALNTEAGINPDDEVSINSVIKKNYALPVWFKYAASVLLFTFITASFYINKWNKKEQAEHTQIVKNDAVPGSDKAILTLANGKKIMLGTLGTGTIAQQGSTQVEKVKGGHLVYQALNNNSQTQGGAIPQEVTYNTISTPKGGQYAVTLPDGSKVWLNSISSITFPTEFKGHERNVSITGEVYFEVAKNKNMPFIVQSNGQNVKVLGTHFNINAYDDENKTRTTLLEGSVQISANNSSKILTPGQQADVDDHQITIINGSDAETAVAWKNGNFIFNDADLPSLMRQLARWYDVNIIYKGDVGEHEFVGQIKRSAKLSSVLQILAVSGIHFTINGKNLYIQP
jgi:transmembrane sensor